ncbi:MAG: hypothetical protein WC243_04185 [Patescibacteria group bacterium]|jgi:hypothetical protein
MLVDDVSGNSLTEVVEEARITANRESAYRTIDFISQTLESVPSVTATFCHKSRECKIVVTRKATNETLTTWIIHTDGQTPPVSLTQADIIAVIRERPRKR